jgi:hypothetical protein
LTHQRGAVGVDSPGRIGGSLCWVCAAPPPPPRPSPPFFPTPPPQPSPPPLLPPPPLPSPPPPLPPPPPRPPGRPPQPPINYDCFSTGDRGEGYRGEHAVTDSGFTCLAWTVRRISHIPHIPYRRPNRSGCVSITVSTRLWRILKQGGDAELHTECQHPLWLLTYPFPQPSGAAGGWGGVVYAAVPVANRPSQLLPQPGQRRTPLVLHHRHGDEMGVLPRAHLRATT